MGSPDGVTDARDSPKVAVLVQVQVGILHFGFLIPDFGFQSQIQNRKSEITRSSGCNGCIRPCEGRGPGSTPGGDIIRLLNRFIQTIELQMNHHWRTPAHVAVASVIALPILVVVADQTQLDLPLYACVSIFPVGFGCAIAGVLHGSRSSRIASCICLWLYLLMFAVIAFVVWVISHPRWFG